MDLTSRRSAVTTSENITELLQLLVDRMPNWIIIAGAEFEILYGNEAVGALQGWNHDVLGTDLAHFLLRRVSREEARHISEFVRGGMSWEGEVAMQRQDGTAFNSHLFIWPLKSGSGSTLGYAVFGAGDTDRKDIVRLLRAQRLESLGTLAGGIAHDFNNILGIIVGHAALLARAGDRKAIEESIQAIERAAKRGTGVARQLLAFVRTSDAILQTVQVNEVTSEIIRLLRETFPKTIRISAELATDLPLIVADSSQIYQVLMNLSLNARDAMPEGGLIRFNTELVKGSSARERWDKADAVEYVLISVSDTGTGMDEATKERIFEPLFTTKGPDKGTGLGLAVVFGIVDKHRGFISVESEPGKGTAVSIYLPTPQMRLTKAEVTGKADIARGGTETILCVEDEEMLLDLLKNELIRNGYNVLTAADGAEAVEVYRRNLQKVNLVVCDLGLPKLDGHQVFERLKWINPSVKFVLSSGYLDGVQKSEIFRSGVRDFIQKPYATDEILKKMREILDPT